MKRYILGFLLAPISSGLLQAIAEGNLGAILVISIFAYPIALILGVPSFFLLKEYGCLRFWHITALGTTLGVLCGLLLSLSASDDNFSIQSILLDLGFFGLHGLVVSCVFWLVALINIRSNKSINSQPPAGTTRQSGAT